MIEALAAVVILTIGVIAVYHPLLKSLVVLNDIDSRLEATRLATDELWLLRNNKARLKSIALKGEQGQLIGSERVYDYIVRSTPITEDQILNKIDLAFSWKVSGQLKKIIHTCYVEISAAPRT